MKKLVFALIAALSVALTGCSAFDSEPIEPNILGASHLKFDSKSGTWFVVVDSTQYTIAHITVPDHNPHSYGKTQDVEPVDGMLVTVFTSPRLIGVQAVPGKQSAKQIEELYHTNSTTAVILFGIMLLCVLGIALPRIRKVPVVNADV